MLFVHGFVVARYEFAKQGVQSFGVLWSFEHATGDAEDVSNVEIFVFYLFNLGDEFVVGFSRELGARPAHEEFRAMHARCGVLIGVCRVPRSGGSHSASSRSNCARGGEL